MPIRRVHLRLPAVAAIILSLNGCGFQAADEVVLDPVAVTYEAHGCYGTCPIYRVTVLRDGTSQFLGRDHVAVRGERQFRISPERFRRFAAYLAPLKPERGSVPRDERTECNVHDGPSFTVTWEGVDGTRQSFCLGSHGEVTNPRLAAERLEGAPALLPIASYIGPG